MPDLSGLKPTGVPVAFLLNIFTGAGVSGFPDGKLALRIITLAPVAHREYEAARECIGQPCSLGIYSRGVSHLETCLIVLGRTFAMADQLKRRRRLPKSVAPLLPPRATRRSVAGFRNAIEHADRDILRDAPLADGMEHTAILLLATPQGLQLRHRRMSWEMLAGCIRDVAASALALAEHRDPTA